MSKKFPGFELRILLILFCTCFFLTSCSKEEDECTKTIHVPELRVGGAYYPAYNMEVSCDFEEPGPLELSMSVFHEVP